MGRRKREKIVLSLRWIPERGPDTHPPSPFSTLNCQIQEMETSATWGALSELWEWNDPVLFFSQADPRKKKAPSFLCTAAWYRNICESLGKWAWSSPVQYPCSFPFRAQGTAEIVSWVAESCMVRAQRANKFANSLFSRQGGCVWQCCT